MDESYGDTPLYVLMRLAAATLREANEACGMPPNSAWTAEQLRREADVIPRRIAVIESSCPHCDLPLIYTVFGVLVHEATGTPECPCGYREGS